MDLKEFEEKLAKNKQASIARQLLRALGRFLAGAVGYGLLPGLLLAFICAIVKFGQMGCGLYKVAGRAGEQPDNPMNWWMVVFIPMVIAGLVTAFGKAGWEKGKKR